jgi:Transposase DDE domain
VCRGRAGEGWVNRDYEQIAREILAEADAVDREEDERYGEKRGDELPPHLSTEQGRRGWLRDAKRRLEEKRAEEAAPIPRSRPARLRQAKRRLEEDLDVERAANEAYEAYRARGVRSDGVKLGRPPKPYRPPETPAGKINVTDPDSRNVKTPRSWVQGYNAQAVTNEQQIVIAAEISADSPDFGHLEPMVSAAQSELEWAGVRDTPQMVIADAGYWHTEQMENIVSRGTQVLIPPDAIKRRGARPGWDGGPYAFMRRVLETDTGGGALPKTPGDDRACLRRHEVQPPPRSLLAPRKIRLPLRMAAHHRHPQPAEAFPPPTGARPSLKEPAAAGTPRSVRRALHTVAAEYHPGVKAILATATAGLNNGDGPPPAIPFMKSCPTLMESRGPETGRPSTTGALRSESSFSDLPDLINLCIGGRAAG